VIKVCCKYHFVACCFFRKAPILLILSVIPKFSRKVHFFGNLLISKISSRRPNRVRPFCFAFTNISLRHSTRHFFFCLVLTAIIVFVIYVAY
jgi:hypothetical protein